MWLRYGMELHLFIQVGTAKATLIKWIVCNYLRVNFTINVYLCTCKYSHMYLLVLLLCLEVSASDRKCLLVVSM